MSVEGLKQEGGPRKATVELRHATYVGPLNYLEGSNAEVLMRSDRLDVCRGKILASNAGPLASGWKDYPLDHFILGDLMEKFKAQN